MKIVELLAEAKKKSESNWADDYESGYSSIRDMQKYLGKSIDRLQLFVPKRRDPKVELERERNARWASSVRDVEKALKEETTPILTAFKESPVAGQNKPTSAFWTSSATKMPDGTYRSEWSDFVQQRFKSWQTDYGFLFEVDQRASVLDSSHLDQFYEWAERTNRLKPIPDWASKFHRDDVVKLTFPWDVLSRFFDGVRHTGYNDDFTYGWDVESTAWFNTSVLKYKGAVKLYTGNEDN